MSACSFYRSRRRTSGARHVGCEMGWMLVVSEDEKFQREAISSANQPVVGATGDSSARSLVREVDVDRIVIDALDDVGRRFMVALRSLPLAARAHLDVIVIGPSNIAPGFQSEPDIAAALTLRSVTQAA